MTEQELFNEYRKSNCKSFSDFLINKIAELEAQIEKMKFCENCMFENTPKVLLPCHICVAKSNWKPKEINDK